MNFANGLFFLFAFFALFGSLWILVQRNLLSSVFSFLLVFLSFAGIYALLGSPLLAAFQVFIYAGAILVLFLFVLLLLNPKPIESKEKKSFFWVFSGWFLGFASVFLILKNLIVLFQKNHSWIPVRATSIQEIAEWMFSEHAFAFEWTSVFVLCGIIIGIVMSKHQKKEDEHA